MVISINNQTIVQSNTIKDENRDSLERIYQHESLGSEGVERIYYSSLFTTNGRNIHTIYMLNNLENQSFLTKQNKS